MISRRVGTFYRVRDILFNFVQMGCEVRTAEPSIRLDNDLLNVRYLLNQETKDFAPVVDLDDDDLVSEGEVGDWERRLQLRVPRPQPMP